MNPDEKDCLEYALYTCGRSYAGSSYTMNVTFEYDDNKDTLLFYDIEE